MSQEELIVGETCVGDIDRQGGGGFGCIKQKSWTLYILLFVNIDAFEGICGPATE